MRSCFWGVPLQTRGETLTEALTRPAGQRSLAALAGALCVGLLAGCGPQQQAATDRVRMTVAAHGLSDASLFKISARMDPAMREVARRNDPFLRRQDPWGRPAGWTTLDIRTPPDLGFDPNAAPEETAQELNDLRPLAKLPIRPMRPFVLETGGDDRARALRCLTQAIYYEAAREPEKGQEAVAQVVLNRMRHPAYPKSICGVVYQGSARATGCQFTFTCDGSLRWAPEPGLWAKAQAVAKRALAGYVDKQVGSATHYHANYVSPYWAPTLVKMAKVGAHIFYRWTGPWGEPPAFTGRYGGREAYLTPAILGGIDRRTQGGRFAPEDENWTGERKISLAVAGEVRTYTIADPKASGGQRTRVLGTIQPSRRQPTAEEVKRINDSLAGMDETKENPLIGKAPAKAPAKVSQAADAKAGA